MTLTISETSTETGRFVDADKVYGEALTIRRDIAAHHPGAYRPSVAATLNNLGILYRTPAASPTPTRPSARR